MRLDETAVADDFGQRLRRWALHHPQALAITLSASVTWLALALF
jgi:hypothetical protein